MKKIKGLLVNPLANSVTEIEIDDDYKAMQAAIGCSCFTKATTINGNQDVWCDDEGLIDGSPVIFLTKINAYPEPLAGNLLILGHNAQGESIDTTITPDEFISSQQPSYQIAMLKS